MAYTDITVGCWDCNYFLNCLFVTGRTLEVTFFGCINCSLFCLKQVEKPHPNATILNQLSLKTTFDLHKVSSTGKVMFLGWCGME